MTPRALCGYCHPRRAHSLRTTEISIISENLSNGMTFLPKGISRSTQEQQNAPNSLTELLDSLTIEVKSSRFSFNLSPVHVISKLSTQWCFSHISQEGVLLPKASPFTCLQWQHNLWLQHIGSVKLVRTQQCTHCVKESI